MQVTLHAIARAGFAIAIALGPAVAAQEPNDSAVAAPLERWALPSAAESIRPDSVGNAVAPIFTDQLTARIPGVLVLQSSGVQAAAARIYLRGVNTLTVDPQNTLNPVLLVDGIRVDNAQGSGDPTSDALRSSRLNDLSPDEIERIVVLKGPATSAMYGSGASAGVILIETKRGQPGGVRWQAHAGLGAAVDATTYPSNFARTGTSPANGSRVTNCTVAAQLDSSCVALPDSLNAFNPLMEASPFRTGPLADAGLRVFGGGDRATFSLAANGVRNQGVLDADRVSRGSGRASAQLRVGESARITGHVGYLDEAVRAPYSLGLEEGGVLRLGLLGSATDDSLHGYRGPLGAIQGVSSRETIRHWTTGVSGEWTPARWLSAFTDVGYDRTAQLLDWPLLGTTGNPNSVTRDEDTQSSWTIRGGATGSYRVTSDVRGTTTLGLELVRQRLSSDTRQVQGAFPLDPGSSPAQGRRGANLHTGGVYLEQTFSWRDRVFLSGGLRREGFQETDTSSFSSSQPGSFPGLIFVNTTPVGTDIYPMVGAAWLISNEKFFPTRIGVSSLRVRGSYGRAGTGGPEVLGGSGGVERVAESELGLDAGIFDDRARASFTYYRKTSLNASYVASLPVGDRLEDDAQVRNVGVEGALHMTLLSERSLTWDVLASGWHNSNRVSKLGSAVSVGVNAVQYSHIDYPVGAYWNLPYTYQDKNHNGVLEIAGCDGSNEAACEVQVDPQLTYLGSSIPTTELTFGTSLMLGRRLRVTALLDHVSGFDQFDQTAFERCAVVENCAVANDDIAHPTQSLAEQARYLAGRLGSFAGYIEDASFWKLRELSVAFEAPDRLARSVGARRLDVTFAARNLLTWTPYHGLDPEVNAYGQAPLQQLDLFTQPVARTFLLRLDVDW